MIKPNFFIVGAMKAGSTSLFDALVQHPEIFMPIEKEPFYYIWGYSKSEDFHIPLNDKRMTDSTRWRVVDTKEKYYNLFNDAIDMKRVGEASTFYLPDKNVAGRIKAEHPKAKIIIILRNPVERAYSAFTFQQSFGLEPCESFREAMEQEIAGVRDSWLYGWRHLYCGLYYSQVKLYIDTFGADNVHVCKMDDLKVNPNQLFKDVLGFLDVDNKVSLVNKKSNPTVIPSKNIGKITNLLFSRPNYLKDSIKRVLPLNSRRKLKSKILNYVYENGMKPAPLTLKDRTLLMEYYYNDVRNLEELLGWNLNAWIPTN